MYQLEFNETDSRGYFCIVNINQIEYLIRYCVKFNGAQLLISNRFTDDFVFILDLDFDSAKTAKVINFEKYLISMGHDWLNNLVLVDKINYYNSTSKETTIKYNQQILEFEKLNTYAKCYGTKININSVECFCMYEIRKYSCCINIYCTSTLQNFLKIEISHLGENLDFINFEKHLKIMAQDWLDHKIFI